jgi:hypothetical protein
MQDNKDINSTITIKKLADQLQKRIDICLEDFMTDYVIMKSLYNQIEELEKRMHTIIVELEPVQSLIYTQNPELERIFESLKRIYGKDENEFDRGAH